MLLLMKINAAHYKTGKVVEFTFRDGRLVSSRPSRSRTGLLYGPGLFDIQVNGFAGVDFNHADFTPESFRVAVHAMWRYGTTHVMPTIITAPPEKMAFYLGVIRDAMGRFPELRRCMAGVHQEGPYFANLDGVRGAHPPENIVLPTVPHFNSMQKAAGGMIRMLTLAPEVKGALPFIRTLSKRGVMIAIGHTHSTPVEIRAGVDAGARISTHLGNGSEQIMPRHHNYMLAQLADDRLYASFIPDGHHLPPFVLQTFFRAKPAEKRILTTDCMAAAGAPVGRYTIGRLVVEVGRDRQVRQPGKPNFAGSAITMDEGITNAVRLGGVSLQEAWDMSSVYAWNLMRRASLVREPSLGDTFIIARHAGGRFGVQATVIGRKLVYSR